MRLDRRRWPLLALAVAAVLPLHEAVFAGRVLFYRDIHLAWHPAMESFVRAVAQGSWPLWNPATAFGQPFLADPQWMLAYPPTWLNLALPPWAYYTVFAVAHLWWTALGTYRLGRRWRCSPVSAATAACLWSLSGPALSLVSLYHHFASACWMPWVFLTGERALLTRRRPHVLAWAAVMAAQILAGSADMTALTWLALAAYAAARTLRWRRPLARRNLRLVAAAAAAVLLAAAIAAIVWMPALELVSRSSRRALPLDTRTYWSLHPLGLAEVWLPQAWRLPGLRPELSAALFEGREPFLLSIYLGITTIPLMAAAFAGRRPRRGVLGVLAAAALGAALGRHFIAYSAITALLPPLGVFRYPVKTFVLFAWLWALLCGQGVEAWRRGSARRRAWALPFAAGATAAGAAAAAASWLLLRPQGAAALLLADARAGATMEARGWSLAGAAAAAAAMAILAAARWRRPAVRAPLAAAAAALALTDVAVHGRSINATAPRQLYARPPVVDLLREAGARRVLSYTYTFRGGPRDLRHARVPELAEVPSGWSPPAATALAQEMTLAPMTAARWGIEAGFEGDPTGLHPTTVAELENLLPLLDGTTLHVRLLRIGGVSHVLSLDPRADLVPLASLPVLLEAPLGVYAVPGALPLAYAVGRARTSEHAGALLQPDFDPASEVILEPTAPVIAGTPGPAGEVRIVRRAADRLTLTAEMAREGYLVVLDTYDPGWRARVDGRAQPLLRANTAFRALLLPAGRHVVDMTYRPAGVLAGALVSGLGLAALAVLGLAGRARNRGRPRTP